MIDFALSMLLQVSGQATGPEQQTTPTAPVEAAVIEPEKPKIICSMEPVTGTRAAKRKVCKPVGGFPPGSEEAKELLRQIQNGSGNTQPTLPKGIGG